MTKSQYLEAVGPDGAMFVGNPEEVAKKMIKIIETPQLDRFMLHIPVGSMPHEDTLRTIRLFGDEVASILPRDDLDHGEKVFIAFISFLQPSNPSCEAEKQGGFSFS